MAIISSVPAPTLMVTTDSTTVYANSPVTLSCVVKVVEEVDTPVTIHTQWSTPSPTNGNSRISIREENISPLVFRSVVSIDSVIFSDAGLYTCITNVDPRNGHSLVSGIYWTTKGLTLTVCKCYMNMLTMF